MRVISLESGYVSSAKSEFYAIIHGKSKDIIFGINDKHPELNIIEKYKSEIASERGFFISSNYWFEFLSEDELKSVYDFYLGEVVKINEYLKKNLLDKKISSSNMLALLKSKKK